MNRRVFLGQLGLATLFSGASARSWAARKQPNILLIVSDDHGYGDISCYGGCPDVETPNLDRLAESGVRFTDAYVSHPVCSPSRAGMETGRYQSRWGNIWYGRGGLPQDEITLAEALKNEGYTTGYFGKVHYGKSFSDDKNEKFPLNHGFDRFFGYCAHTIHYYKHTQKEARAMGKAARKLSAGQMWDQRERCDTTEYTTTLFADKACRFMSANREKPFFAQVAFNAVHNYVHQFPEEYLAKHNLPKIEDWDSSKEPYKKWYKRTLNGDQPINRDPEMRQLYLACLKRLDQEIGKLLDHLTELGLRDDTLVFYITDNGGSPRTTANNAPLSGHKYMLGEGGIRVPFIVSWPGVIPQGRVVREPVISLDIFPTATYVASGRSDSAPQSDGENLMPLLRDRTEKGIHEALFWVTKTEYAVRKGDWKLYVTRRNWTANLYNHIRAGKRLYNLRKDPGEGNNLYDKMPAKANELQEEFKRWDRKTNR